MTQAAANCPNCGAGINFRWAQSVQTVCDFCKSILVRHDVNLEKVGEVAELPRDASPIQIGTEGAFKNKPFVVVGRIIYEYEQGGWNEWHVVFSDSTSGWLSDAQLEYAVTVQNPNPPKLPPSNEIKRGQRYQWGGVIYEVTTLTHARYRGVEGELPFEYWDKEQVLFGDLRSTGPHFATIDYTEDPPLLFTGEFVELEDLKLRNLREFEEWEPWPAR